MKISKINCLFVLLALVACATPQRREQKKLSVPLPNAECQEGTMRQGFLSPQVAGSAPCVRGSQNCLASRWSGPPLYDTCDNFTKGCDAAPHGATMTGYLQASVPHGSTCLPATKTCLNGAWAGPEVFPFCTVLP